MFLKVDKDQQIIEVRIGDFGICKSNEKHICENGFSGTPNYTAPEMFNFGSHFDSKVDVWCLGLIFHYMLFEWHPLM